MSPAAAIGVAALVAAHGAHPERLLPAYVPGGVADGDGTIVLVRTPDGGVDAVDAPSGETRWGSAAPARALLVARGTAYVLEERDPRALRVSAYDARTGRPAATWPLAGIELPPWAALRSGAAAREDVRVSVKARLAGTVLEIEYDARRTLVTGTGPRPGGDAHGVARLDLASGRTAFDRGARFEPIALAVPASPAAELRPARFHARDADASIVLGGPPPDLEGFLSTPDGLVGFERAPGRIVVHRWSRGEVPRRGRGRTFEIAGERDAIWVTLDRRHVALRRARDQRVLDVHALETGAPVATGVSAVDLAVVGGRLFWTSLGSRGEVILNAVEPRSGGAAWRRVVQGPPAPAGDPIP